jgi:hypothetical protein
MILVTTPQRLRQDAEAVKEVDLVLPLPAGIFAPMLGDSYGLSASDWNATRESLLKGLFGSELEPA